MTKYVREDMVNEVVDMARSVGNEKARELVTADKVRALYGQPHSAADELAKTIANDSAAGVTAALALLLGFCKGDAHVSTKANKIIIGLSSSDLAFQLLTLLPVVGGLGAGTSIKVRSNLTGLRRVGARRLPTFEALTVLTFKSEMLAAAMKERLGGGSKDTVGDDVTCKKLL